MKEKSIEGYEDIHEDEPYLRDEIEGEVAYLDMLYVPPSQRGHGVGSQLVLDWIQLLDPQIKRIKLKACTLGGSDALSFYTRLGFTQAYTGNIPENSDIHNTLTLGVNGYSNPVPETISVDDIDRHWHEDANDDAHFYKHPQVKERLKTKDLRAYESQMKCNFDQKPSSIF